MVSFCVQVGLQRSRRGGWNFIAPVLRYRAVVPRNTGAFRVLEDAATSLRLMSYGQSQKKAADILINTTSTLQRMFTTNASPYDVDQEGDSLLYAALDVVHAAVMCGIESSNTLQSFLDVCNAPDVSHTNIRNRLSTPMELWQQILRSNIDPYKRGQYRLYRDVLYYLAQRSGDWTLNDAWEIWYYRQHPQELYDMISTMMKLENMDSYLDEDDPLVLAILRRSKSEFEKCISKSDHTLLKTPLSRGYIEALASWPEAVGILSSRGFFDVSNILVEILWQYSVRTRSVESIEVLTRYKKQISFWEWSNLNDAWTTTRDWATTREVDEMRWAGIFDAALARLQPICLTDSSIEDGDCDQIATGTISPYHTTALTMLGAERAWKAGYRGLNTPDWADGWESNQDIFGTPLWVLTYPLLNIPVITWLMDHGADPFWIHPQFLTTPAHNIVREVQILAGGKGDVTILKSFEALLLSRTRDRCTCFCSEHGCCCVGLAASKTSRWIYETLQGNQNMRHIVFPYLFGVVDRHKKEHWMSSAVFRMMTFEKLSLTHTCCYRIIDEIDGRTQRPTAEERSVIRELERDDIELLEKLVAEFEMKWANYDNPFVTFMNRVWKRRMRQVKEAGQVDEQKYQAELLRLGVTLKEPDEEEIEELESNWPDDYESDDGRDGWYTTDDDDEDGDAEDEDI